jgi:hypothetical protein
LTVSLAVLPLSAAVAMGHGAKAEMAMSATGDDCPCCQPAVSDACPLVCCHVTALAASGWMIARPRVGSPLDAEAGAFVANIVRPEPPPPRS